jgi:hypothetical protein
MNYLAANILQPQGGSRTHLLCWRNCACGTLLRAFETEVPEVTLSNLAAATGMQSLDEGSKASSP